MPEGGRPQVLIVGSINVDLVVRVARLPRPGETVTGGVFTRHHGGKGANQAVAAARLGAEVRFVGAVGDDEDGRAALHALEAEGIDTRRVAVLPGAATGVALISVDERGENQISVAPGANGALDEARVGDLLEGWEAGSGVYLANFEVSDDAMLAGARFARRNGLRLVVNPAPARPLSPELLAMDPILVANAGEAAILGGEGQTGAAARALFERTGQPVVVTLGSDGALLWDGAHESRVSAPDVAAVDTTGAGDTFSAALAVELARGAGIAQAVRFAVAAASLSVTRAGARGGMPTRDELWRAGWDSNPGHED